ncbi:MAG TPA: lytic transglycosylase [Desulfobacteraceae bacterium]|nr:lytic transglycosylase [Desulfobacteraceae bacterium]
MKVSIKIFSFLFLLTLASRVTIYADIYMYIDEAGIIHYTNIPTSPGYKLYLKEYPKYQPGLYFNDMYDHLIIKASKEYGVPFQLLKAVIKAESDFNTKAVSKAGAMGLMQIMPKNFKAFNINNPYDPSENIMGGTRYLKSLLQQFAWKFPLALAAYNAGPNRVIQYNDIPPFKETEKYVKKVMRYYNILKKQ